MQPKLQYTPPCAQSFDWVEPLELASGIADPYVTLLYSGVQSSYSGRYSYLAWNLAECVDGDDFSTLEQTLSQQGDSLFPSWFGYLGYGLKDSLEKLTPEHPYGVPMPKLRLMRFHTVCVCDHEQRRLTLWSDVPATLPQPRPLTGKPPAVTNLRSNMSTAEYLEKVAFLIERIHAGDLYQANLTRKFMGEFSATPDAFSLFRHLSKKTPAPYSVFMKMGQTAVLSSSPERFLTLDASGHVTARPIKGTAPRHADPVKDAAARQALTESSKDRAENLMIVDLMRNDLSRACIPGSIKTDMLFEPTTHATIHHLSSTISGQKRPDCSTASLIRQCFPPGSMTGAPKIRAMDICAQLEHEARGIYSGAIGWFGGDGSCDLSVVIRTLILHDRSFEFQVGGGIVADSQPEAELAETLDKAKGLSLALGIKKEALKGL